MYLQVFMVGIIHGPIRPLRITNHNITPLEFISSEEYHLRAGQHGTSNPNPGSNPKRYPSTHSGFQWIHNCSVPEIH